MGQEISYRMNPGMSVQALYFILFFFTFSLIFLLKDSWIFIGGVKNLYNISYTDPPINKELLL